MKMPRQKRSDTPLGYTQRRVGQVYRNRHGRGVAYPRKTMKSAKDQQSGLKLNDAPVYEDRMLKRVR